MTPRVPFVSAANSPRRSGIPPARKHFRAAYHRYRSLRRASWQTPADFASQRVGSLPTLLLPPDNHRRLDRAHDARRIHRVLVRSTAGGLIPWLPNGPALTVLYSARPLVHYRTHPAGTSSSQSERLKTARERIVAEAVVRLGLEPLSDDVAFHLSIADGTFAPTAISLERAESCVAAAARYLTQRRRRCAGSTFRRMLDGSRTTSPMAAGEHRKTGAPAGGLTSCAVVARTMAPLGPPAPALSSPDENRPRQQTFLLGESDGRAPAPRRPASRSMSAKCGIPNTIPDRAAPTPWFAAAGLGRSTAAPAHGR